MTKQIDIQEIISYLEDGWVAMDKDGTWFWYEDEPIITKNAEVWDSNGGFWEEINLPSCFIITIKPVKNWRKSLIKVENKDE